MASPPVGDNASQKKKTGIFEPQGHTSGAYGNDPAVTQKGEANKRGDLNP